MCMKVGKKWFGWLAGLALWPVVAWGQTAFVTHPQSVTVCAGEKAVFIVHFATNDLLGHLAWFVGGSNAGFLPSQQKDLIEFSGDSSGTNRQGMATFSYSQVFNGITVQAVWISGDPNIQVRSHLAYLFYKTNQQFLVTGLIGAVNNTTAWFTWDTHDSNFTTQYLVGVYDGNNNLIANQTINTTYASFDLSSMADGTCQQFQLRVTADQCPDPNSDGFVQIEATTFNFTIDCSTTPETGASGTQASYSSLLLAAAAVIPLLLKWQH